MTQLPPSPKDIISSSGNHDEQRVNLLFLYLGFEFIDANAKFFRDDTEIGEIDGIFKIANNVLLVETKNKKDLRSNEVIAFYEKWTNSDNDDLIRQKYNLQRYRFVRIFVDLHHKNPGSDPTLRPILSDSNHIFYKDDFEIIEENYSLVGDWERNNLLRKLKIKKEASSVQKDAIYCHIAGKKVFLFSLPADELLQCSTITRRYIHDTGYQRSIRRGRITTMRRRIESGSILAFPNSILVNSETELILPSVLPNPYLKPVFIKINLPNDYSFLKVIDGQHRLLAFTKLDSTIQQNHDLTIIAFDGLSFEEETDLFIEINTTQVRVDPSLVLLLKSSSADNPIHKYWYEKIGVDIAKELDRKSILKNKIYMGYAETAAKNKLITLKTLVTALKTNYFIGTSSFIQRSPVDSQSVIKRIKSILNRLRTKGLISAREDFFLRDKGIRILFRLIYVYNRNINAGKASIPEDITLDLICTLIDQPFLAQIKAYSGLSGTKQAVDEIITKLRSNGDYANLESDLRLL